MKAKEVYEIMKALNEITGPKESVKVIREFVERQLDDKINYRPITINPTWPTTPSIQPLDINQDWILTSVGAKDTSNVTFTQTMPDGVSWTDGKDPE